MVFEVGEYLEIAKEIVEEGWNVVEFVGEAAEIGSGETIAV